MLCTSVNVVRKTRGFKPQGERFKRRAHPRVCRASRVCLNDSVQDFDGRQLGAERAMPPVLLHCDRLGFQDERPSFLVLCRRAAQDKRKQQVVGSESGDGAMMNVAELGKATDACLNKRG